MFLSDAKPDKTVVSAAGEEDAVITHSWPSEQAQISLATTVILAQ